MQNRKSFNGERLRSARLYRNKTIVELVEETGVSKQSISQFENGKASPGFETLMRIAHALDFPREYFCEKDENNIAIGNTYFRALMTTNKKERLSQIERIKMLAKVYHFLNEYVDFPKVNIPNIDYENLEIERIAGILREQWGLGQEPIGNMVKLLEKNGFVVTTMMSNGMKIDAFSQKQIYRGNDYYFIILSEDKNSATRRQFDAAHELGHVLLHDWYLDLEQVTKEEFRQVETDANQFAAAFLLPKESFLADLHYPTKIEFYIELKKKWKVSISAMIMRAQQLGAINYNQYQYLMRQLSQKGWRTREPLDDILQIPRPSLLKKAIDVLLANDVFQGEEILNGLSSYGLSIHKKDLEQLLGIEPGVLVSNATSGPIINIRTILSEDK